LHFSMKWSSTGLQMLRQAFKRNLASRY
jgi:hypothetical protein